jgi:DNA polymerase-3 subunit beta
MVLSPAEMTIHSEDVEFGAEAKEVIPVSFSDEWLQVGYNSNYLMDILRHLDSEELVFDLKDSSSAAIIHPATQNENEDVVMLLMPIRLNEEEAVESEPEPDVSEDSDIDFE